MSKKKNLKGQFVSVLEHVTVSTSAELEVKSGYILNVKFNVNSIKSQDLGSLKREYFVDEWNDKEYEVCPECREYVLKTVINPDNVGCGLHEEQICSDPDCESHE
jgi:hypothetical protein